MPAENLLFEIGTEELPPKSLNRLRQALAANCEQGFRDAGLTFNAINSYATPRRLAIHVENLLDRQPDQEVERRGPAVKAAFDEAGEPTKALQGFMRSCEVTDADSLERLKTDKGEWLVYRATKPGSAMSELLAAILEKALADLPIDRRMRWGKKRAEFVRPVQWTLCLYGQTVLPISVLGFDADRLTRGHRFMSTGNASISDADSYVESLRNEFVVADFSERRATILEQIQKLAADYGADLELDNALLDEVTALVEWPVALLGEFESRFLQVPQEVLISAMKEHQRYFHLVDSQTGDLKPAFITVSNVASNDPALVVAGNERVIRPRLSDAAFFFEQDTKTPLADRVEKLGNVVFQTDLGTYHQKAQRISTLAGKIAGQLGADADAAARAGLLCKADLVSDMVGEFPDLQGIMGAYYASHDGESNDVAKGVQQHYRPVQAGSELPEGAVASSVALADKLDTIVGLFGINQPPTGSRDPFALRRQSLGVIRICIENELDLDLAWALNQAAECYGQGYLTDAALSYVIERLTGYYQDQGISGDTVNAVSSALTEGTILTRMDNVIRAVHQFKSDAVADQVIAANKRIANILKKAAPEDLEGEFDLGLATEAAEVALANQLADFTLTDDNAEAQLKQLASLQAPVDQFFDDVMVMSDDGTVRKNRLVLLQALRALFLKVADFSLLQ